ncbi:hypothetical protein MNBD_GAMMA12-2578 [hydrothermal vent metagenome]|uniref:DUF3592 domain-containing protein n=1 Tax=hydrothermal vent metagenome TaxID=652676 RepID=A0A3B0YJB1_9ZZZZ
MVGFCQRIVLKYKNSARLFLVLSFFSLLGFLFIKTVSVQPSGQDPISNLFFFGMIFTFVNFILIGIINLIRELELKALTKLLTYSFLLSLAVILYVKFFSGDAVSGNRELRIAIFGLIISGAGIFATVLANTLIELIHNVRAHRKLLLAGFRTQGVIVSIEVQDIPEGPSLYLGGLKFKDQQGKQFIICRWVGSPDTGGEVKKGDTRNLLYDPENPGSCLASIGEFPNYLGTSELLGGFGLFVGFILVILMPVIVYFEIF